MDGIHQDGNKIHTYVDLKLRQARTSSSTNLTSALEQRREREFLVDLDTFLIQKDGNLSSKLLRQTSRDRDRSMTLDGSGGSPLKKNPDSAQKNKEIHRILARSGSVTRPRSNTTMYEVNMKSSAVAAPAITKEQQLKAIQEKKKQSPNPSQMPTFYIPIFPGMFLEVQNVVEYRVNQHVKQQLEKYKQLQSQNNSANTSPSSSHSNSPAISPQPSSSNIIARSISPPPKRKGKH
jgi:hypothetical protein